MNNFFAHYVSTLTEAYKLALSRLLGTTASEQSVTYTSPTFTGISDYTEYNAAQQQIYSSLFALFAEANNIDAINTRFTTQFLANVDTLKSAVADLSARISSAKLTATKISFTDSVINTFNSTEDLETDKSFYANGIIPQAYMDPQDGNLKLPLGGEVTGILSPYNGTPSNVFIDRVYGIPMSEGNEVNKAFDNTVLNYWCEVLHTPAPAYASTAIHTWLPSIYTGGAACRVRIDFDYLTQLSELYIRPYGEHPQKLLTLHYVDGSSQMLQDPNFLTYGKDVSSWFVTTRSYGATGGGSVELLSGAGLAGENVLHLSTTAGTGACHVINTTMFGVVGVNGLDVSISAKTLGDYPLEIKIIFFAEGPSGTIYTVREVSETFMVEGIGWTNINVAFDVPLNTTMAKFVVGIPPTMGDEAHLYISSPRIESLKTVNINKLLDKNTIVQLDAPVFAKRAWLVISQEQYDFKQYTVKRLDAGIPWDRLARRKYIDPRILSWDRRVRRHAVQALHTAQDFESSTISSAMRYIEGTYAEILDEIQKIANEEDVSIAGYEYIIGAFEIYLRHREYLPYGRFVSKPIKVGGEIRELAIVTNDHEVEPGCISYRITANKDDAVERGHYIQNSANQIVGTHDSTKVYFPWITAPSTGTSRWTAGASGFAEGGPEEIVSDFITNITSKLQHPVTAFTIRAAANRGDYVRLKLDSSLDISEMHSLVFELFLGEWWENYYISDRYKFASFNTTWKDPLTQKTVDRYPVQITLEDEDGAVLTSNYAYLIPNDIRSVTTPTYCVLSTATIGSSSSKKISYITLTLTDRLGKLSDFTAQFSYAYAHIFGWVVLSSVYSVSGGIYRNIRFIPADDTSLVENSRYSDFIVPIRHQKKIFSGTDRYGRVILDDYPYINKNKMLNLLTILSAHTGGRQVTFDPNAAYPKYLESPTKVGTTTGYRPILVTIRFINNEIVALPDTVGKPDPGDVGFAEMERLELANVTQTTAQYLESITGGSTGRTTTTKQVSHERRFYTYETAMKPLVSGPNGIPIKVYKVPVRGGDIIPVDSSNLQVDAVNGLVEIAIQPDENFYFVASYYYIMNEFSLRESFLYDSATSRAIEEKELTPLNVQSYPVTRNMTDYMYGKQPTLRKANLDKMSTDYYPVYEYYVHPDGYLVFADDFHPYSDTPANIEVEFDTMSISPRLIIDINRPTFADITPMIDDYSILLNVRRG